MITTQSGRVHEQFLALITDEMRPVDFEKFTDHVAQCQVCRDTEVALQVLFARYRTLEAPPLSATAEQRILQACWDCLAIINETRSS